MTPRGALTAAHWGDCNSATGWSCRVNFQPFTKFCDVLFLLPVVGVDEIPMKLISIFSTPLSPLWNYLCQTQSQQPLPALLLANSYESLWSQSYHLNSIPWLPLLTSPHPQDSVSGHSRAPPVHASILEWDTRKWNRLKSLRVGWQSLYKHSAHT